MALNKRVQRRLILLSILIVLITTGLIGGFFYARWNREQQVLLAAEQGMEAYEAGDYLTALPKLSKAVSTKKDDLELTLALGQSRLRNIDPNGRHVRASEKFFLHALSLDPKNEEALRELVNIYIATGDTANVITYSDRLPDDDIDIIAKRVSSLRSSGRYEEALAETARIRDLEPNNGTWPLYEFTLYEEQGIPVERRIATSLELAESYPDNQGIQLALVSLYRMNRQIEQAEEMARRLAGMPSIDDEIIMILLQQLESMKLSEESATVLEAAEAAASTNPEVAHAILDRIWRQSMYTEGLELALEAADAFPDDIGFLREAAEFAALSGDQAAGEDVYERFLTRSKEVDTARGRIDEMTVAAFRSRTAKDIKALRESIEAIDEVLELAGNQKALLVIKAEQLQKSGQADAAVGLYRDIFERTGSRSAGRQLATLLLQLNRSQEALRHGLELHRNYPSLDSLLVRMQAWIAMKRTGLDIGMVDSSFNDGSKVTDKILDTYTRSKDLIPESSARILVYLAEAAGLEGDRETIEYAIEEALNSDSVTGRELLLILAVDERNGGANGDRLLQRASDKGASSFDTTFALAERARYAGEEAAAIAIISDLGSMQHSSDAERRRSQRRLLGFLARSSSEEVLPMIRRIFDDLEDDAASARIVCSYPDIWKRSPELAMKALAQVERLLGSNSNPYRLANARRVINMAIDDESERADAIVELNEVVQASPGSVDALLLLSDMLRSGRSPDLSASASYMRKAIDAQPNQTSLYPILIQMLQQIGDRERAIQYLEKYQDVATGSAAARTRVALYVGQGDSEKAIGELTAIANESGSILDRTSLALFLARVGRVEESLEQYGLILDAEPDNRFAFDGKVILLATIGRIGEALSIVENSEEIDEHKKLSLVVELHNAASDVASALAACDVLVAEHPDKVSTWLITGRIRAANMDLAGARSAFRQALEIEPDNGVALGQLAPLLVSEPGSWPEAREMLPRLEEESPLLAEVLSLKMDASDPVTGRFDSGPEDLERALELIEKRPNAIASYHIAWTMHNAVGDDGRAIDIASTAMNRLPNEVTPPLWAFETAIASGDLEAALKFARAARARAPQGRKLQHDLRIADVAMLLDRYSDASGSLLEYESILGDEESIALNVQGSARNGSTVPNMLRRLTMHALLGTGRADKAMSLFRELMNENPMLVTMWLSLLDELQPDDARAALTEISEILEETPEGRIEILNRTIAIAGESGDEGDRETARRMIEVLGEELPDHARSIKLARARLAENSGEDAACVVLYEELIDEYSPEEVASFDSLDALDPAARAVAQQDMLILLTALNNVAYKHASMENGDHDRGMEAIDRAIDMRVRGITAELLDTRATLLVAMGEENEALDVMKDVIRRAPNRLDFRVRTIKLFRDLGMLEEARTLAEECRQLSRIRRFKREELEKLRVLIEEID